MAEASWDRQKSIEQHSRKGSPKGMFWLHAQLSMPVILAMCSCMNNRQGTRHRQPHDPGNRTNTDPLYVKFTSKWRSEKKHEKSMTDREQRHLSQSHIQHFSSDTTCRSDYSIIVQRSADTTYESLFLSSVLNRGFAFDRFLRAWMAKAATDKKEESQR